MSYDLISESGVSVNYDIWTYHKFLELAYDYGWRPEGVTLPAGSSPTTDDTLESVIRAYLDNDGQIVSSSDAASLAKALMRAHFDIPDQSGYDIWRSSPDEPTPNPVRAVTEAWEAGLTDALDRSAMGEDLGPFSGLLEDPCETPRHFFAGNRKWWVSGMVRFCMGGGFTIR